MTEEALTYVRTSRRPPLCRRSRFARRGRVPVAGGRRIRRRILPRQTRRKSASSAPREPHAIVRAIRKERALASPGVIAVLTASDLDLVDDVLPCVDMIPGTLDVRQRVMARDRVRYVGQPVALVVAANRYLAEDAAALVEIDYESLPPVTDHMAAMDPGAPCCIRNWGQISFIK